MQFHASTLALSALLLVGPVPCVTQIITFTECEGTPFTCTTNCTTVSAMAGECIPNYQDDPEVGVSSKMKLGPTPFPLH